MIEWFESMGHWAFISVSYALMVFAILIDIVSQRMGRRQLTQKLQQQRARRRLRKGS